LPAIATIAFDVYLCFNMNT